MGIPERRKRASNGKVPFPDETPVSRIQILAAQSIANPRDNHYEDASRFHNVS